MWHYKLANFDCIQRAIKHFGWENAFDVNKKMLPFNETILNIIRNFIPRKIVTCDDRDTAWTRLIKKAIKDKNIFYQRFVKNVDLTNNNSNLEGFCSLQNNVTITIKTAKTKVFRKNCHKII